MRPTRYLQNVLIGASALVFAGAQFSKSPDQPGPVLDAAIDFVTAGSADLDSASARKTGEVGAFTRAALDAFTGRVRPLSRPEALANAFKSYFAYRTAHPGEIRNPYLYFVDYGLPSTEPRGYVFNMDSMQIVDGPFTVAHGRGSSKSKYGIPTRFSNVSGSAATSLGLYVTKSVYGFSGHAGGRAYSDIGMRLEGVSKGFNDNAFARRVVAHGAPYVTPTGAGRSEGCPAMESARAKRLLPKLADGGMVFLFAPDADWMSRDPWVAAAD